jgi:hypothetical protein
MHALRITFQGFISAFLLTAASFAQANGGWVITPPTKTYPANPSITATLKSIPEPLASLVLSSKPKSAYVNGSPKLNQSTFLAIYLDVGDDDLKIDPIQWGKICKKTPAGGGLPAGQQCTTGILSQAGVKVELVFDDGKPISDLWNVGGSGGIALIPDDNSREFPKTQFLDKLQATKKLVISYTLRGGARKSATFDVSGSPPVIDSLCPKQCTL